MQIWNDPRLWKHTCEGLADGLLCFAQDLFGTQFALGHDGHVVRFDPEIAERTLIGGSLEDWAQWFLADSDVHEHMPSPPAGRTNTAPSRTANV